MCTYTIQLYILVYSLISFNKLYVHVPCKKDTSFCKYLFLCSPSITPLVSSSQQYFNVTSERFLCCSIALLISPTIVSLSCTCSTMIYSYRTFYTVYKSHGRLTIFTKCTLFSDRVWRFNLLSDFTNAPDDIFLVSHVNTLSLVHVAILSQTDMYTVKYTGIVSV